MEFIEHRAGEKAEKIMQRAGIFAPAVGGVLGAVPQCGFSAAAANLYAGRIISMGTIVAVFLSTSDEMIPILMSGNIPVGTVALVVLYKAIVAIAEDENVYKTYCEGAAQRYRELFTKQSMIANVQEIYSKLWKK